MTLGDRAAELAIPFDDSPDRGSCERIRLTICQPHGTLQPVAQKRTPISDQVRTAIDQSGLSRRRICAEIDLDEASMSKFMSGQRGLSLEVLDRLGLLLRLTVRGPRAVARSMSTKATRR